MLRKQKNMKLFFVLSTVVLIAFALFCKIEAKVFIYSYFDKLFNLTRIFIYLGLLFSWALSVRKRVIHAQIKSVLSVIAVIMGFWLIVREFKFRYVLNQNVIRYLWYSYYIPLLIIPLLALFVAMSLGKNEQYKLPKWTKLLFIPAFCLIALVFTNDWHQLVFRFPQNTQVYSDLNYSYAPVAFVIVSFEFLCSISSLVIMAHKAKTQKKKTRFLLPFIPLGCGIAYLVLYASRVELFTTVFGDFAVVFCLVYAVYFESCIQVGLIHSNERYFDLFKACEGLPIVITDEAFHICYHTDQTIELQQAQMLAALQQPQPFENTSLLHGMRLDGGYAFWCEDISEILSIQQTLKERKEELEERNAFLELEYQKEKEHKTVEEQNRLYDMLQNKTQTQLDTIDSLMNEYKRERDAERKKTLLATIVVLGTFIKRTKNFVLSAYACQTLPEAMLTRAFDESFKALRLLNISGGFCVNTGAEELESESLSRAYDFFESVCEAAMENAAYINVMVGRVAGKIRMSIICDSAVPQAQALCARFPDSRWEAEADETRFILPIAGGDEA